MTKNIFIAVLVLLVVAMALVLFSYKDGFDPLGGVKGENIINVDGADEAGGDSGDGVVQNPPALP